MAPKKKERKQLTDKEKKAKKEKNDAKYSEPNENFRKINETTIGKITTTTEAAHVRGKGILVRETTSTGSTSLVWIPGVKIKKKKEWLSIVEDKPKKKKEGGEEKEKKKKKKK